MIKTIFLNGFIILSLVLLFVSCQKISENGPKSNLTKENLIPIPLTVSARSEEHTSELQSQA